MPLYFFNFESMPTAAASKANDVAGGTIDIWINSQCTLPEAETTARAYVMGMGWLISAMPIAREWPVARLPELGKSMQAKAREAMREGISAFVVAWPKTEGRDDDPVSFRSLPPPEKGGTKQ
jgi:hypothetical protein